MGVLNGRLPAEHLLIEPGEDPAERLSDLRPASSAPAPRHVRRALGVPGRLLPLLVHPAAPAVAGTVSRSARRMNSAANPARTAIQPAATNAAA